MFYTLLCLQYKNKPEIKKTKPLEMYHHEKHACLWFNEYQYKGQIDIAPYNQSG